MLSSKILHLFSSCFANTPT